MSDSRHYPETREALRTAGMHAECLSTRSPATARALAMTKTKVEEARMWLAEWERLSQAEFRL